MNCRSNRVYDYNYCCRHFPQKVRTKLTEKTRKNLQKMEKLTTLCKKLTEKKDNSKKIYRNSWHPPLGLTTNSTQNWKNLRKRTYSDTEIEKHTKHVRKNGKKNGEKTCKKVPRNVSFPKFTTAEKFTHTKKSTTLKSPQKNGQNLTPTRRKFTEKNFQTYRKRKTHKTRSKEP